MRRKPLALLALTGVAAAGLSFAGPLDPPPGPVAGTSKTLAEVEPRTAINAANTPGNANSRFRITQRGSYYLTGNITGVANKHGIEIAASGVTLDLNGFDLLGVAGSLDGVTATLPGATGFTVVNGSVRSWGGDGVNLGGAPCIASALRGLTCSDNSGIGITTGFDAAVSDCISYQNAGGGFTVASATRIARCTASLNGGAGIYAGSTCVVADCLIERNTQDGVRASGDCTIRGNTCVANGFNGSGAGIHVSGSASHIADNLCSDNDSGINADTGGNFIVRNSCAGNTTNFFLVANNVYGPIVNRTAPASPSVNGSSAASTLGSTDANANFAF
jgi:hypothetical protein